MVDGAVPACAFTTVIVCCTAPQEGQNRAFDRIGILQRVQQIPVVVDVGAGLLTTPARFDCAIEPPQLVQKSDPGDTLARQFGHRFSAGMFSLITPSLEMVTRFRADGGNRPVRLIVATVTIGCNSRNV